MIVAQEAHVRHVQPHLSQSCFLHRLALGFELFFGNADIAFFRTVPICDTALIAVDVQDFLSRRALPAQKSVPRPASESLSWFQKFNQNRFPGRTWGRFSGRFFTPSEYDFLLRGPKNGAAGGPFFWTQNRSGTDRGQVPKSHKKEA